MKQQDNDTQAVIADLPVADEQAARATGRAADNLPIGEELQIPLVDTLDVPAIPTKTVRQKWTKAQREKINRAFAGEFSKCPTRLDGSEE